VTFIKIDTLKSGKKKVSVVLIFPLGQQQEAAEIRRRKLCYPIGIYDRKPTNDKRWNETICMASRKETF